MDNSISAPVSSHRSHKENLTTVHELRSIGKDPIILISRIMADEDTSRADSHHSSSPVTPVISNPGTPRSEVSLDVRATPPLSRTTPPLHRSTPPLARATPPLNQGQLQPPHGPHANPGKSSVSQAPPAPSPLAQMHHHQSKYASLLAVIEDMGRDIRPTYAGNRGSTERLKRSIVHARILVRECLMECERSART